MYVNFWGNPFHSTGASTEVFIYKNGKWKRNRTDMVYAGYSLGKYDQGCSVQWGSSGSSTTSNAKDATSFHDDNGYFGWYSLNAVHKIRIGVNIYSYYQQINPCQ